jgi:hypothetical protein
MTRWYAALLEKKMREDGKKSGGKNKYGAQRTHSGFPSHLEEAVYGELILLERAGELRNVERQSSIQLTKYVRWKCDFKVFHVEQNIEIWIEAKGVIKQLWREFGPGELWIYGGDHGRVFITEKIKSERAQDLGLK